MKKLISISILFFTLEMIYAQIDNPFYYEDPFFGDDLRIEISDQQFRLDNEAGVGINSKYENAVSYEIPSEVLYEDYEIEKVNGFNYLTVNGERKLLLLENDELLLVYMSEQLNKTNSAIFIGATQEFLKKYRFASLSTRITSSSHLTEEKVDYEAQNLIYIDLKHPWAEAASGNGLGEEIYMNLTHFSGDKGIIDGFYIINGYISFDSPRLYSENSRLKKFTIISKDKDIERAYEIEDTANPQFIDTKVFCDQEVIIRIDDVYPGTKYEDTCIGGFLFRRIGTRRYN